MHQTISMSLEDFEFSLRDVRIGGCTLFCDGWMSAMNVMCDGSSGGESNQAMEPVLRDEFGSCHFSPTALPEF